MSRWFAVGPLDVGIRLLEADISSEILCGN